MAKFEQKLTDMLRPAVEETGKELLGVEFISAGNNSVLRLFIDHENGINVDDCAEVSRQVGAILDVEDPISSEYSLEVSSPGMDRLLFTPDQYKRYEGQEVQVRSSVSILGRKRFKGPMVNVTESGIELEIDGELYEIPFDLIDKANVVPQF